MSDNDLGLNLFGLSITRSKKPEERSAAITVGLDDDGGALVSTSGAAHYGIYLDTDGIAKNDLLAIQKYREISLFPEVDLAIQDIVNEAITNEDDKDSIKLNLDKLNFSDAFKDKIIMEFDNVIKLLRYKEFSPDIFKRWYIDGRIFYQIIVDKINLKRGIVELIPLDATKMRKVKEVIKERLPNGIDAIKETKEYFLFNENGFDTSQTTNGQMSMSNQGIRLSPDAIIYVPSGNVDPGNQQVLSYLNGAIRVANQLRMLEDATIIYMIARAPERRIFYVDVGNLPKLKADQYIKDIMNRYRNKMVYDSQTGAVKDDKKYMCLAMDTKVPLLDGRTLTIDAIAKEYNEGKKLWAYSCDPKTGEFAPGLISWAGSTRKNAEVIRLTLDNGKTITCTPDHKFPVWNKGLVEAKDLVVGEAMVSHYTKQASIHGSQPYKQIFENKSKKWRFVHNLVSEWKDEKGLSNELLFAEETGFEQLSAQKEQHQLKNHKISSIEYLDEKINTGCITIDGDEVYHNYHTFALDAGIYTKNSLLEDFWMPRRDGGKGTEISTLPGVTNVQGMLDNIEYFKKKLYESLNIPFSRTQGQSSFSLGRSNEISRDEVKFQKFIEKLRAKFSQLLLDALKIQLILKGIVNTTEWEAMVGDIRILFQTDNFFSELKEQEIIQSRLNILQITNQYVGNYYSKEWIWKNILKLSRSEILEMKKQITDEKDDPTAQVWSQQQMLAPPMMPQDPSMMGGNPSMMGQPQDPAAAQDDQQQYPYQ